MSDREFVTQFLPGCAVAIFAVWAFFQVVAWAASL